LVLWLCFFSAEALVDDLEPVSVAVDHAPDADVAVARADAVVDQRVTLLDRKRAQFLTILIASLMVGRWRGTQPRTSR
jgi:hypothetical protein